MWEGGAVQTNAPDDTEQVGRLFRLRRAPATTKQATLSQACWEQAVMIVMMVKNTDAWPHPQGL